MMTMNTEELKVGLVGEAIHEVDMARSAITLGSGTLEVLGTPALVMMVEQICREMVDPLLDSGQTSVGTQINLRHIAPTPIGDTVQLRSEVVSIQKGAINFKIQIWDSVELIGDAEHQRVVIDIDRFLKRVCDKSPES